MSKFIELSPSEATTILNQIIMGETIMINNPHDAINLLIDAHAMGVLVKIVDVDEGVELSLA